MGESLQITVADLREFNSISAKLKAYSIECQQDRDTLTFEFNNEKDYQATVRICGELLIVPKSGHSLDFRP